MIIRNPTLADLDSIFEIENICFSPQEAATRESFKNRLGAFPNHFYVLEENGDFIGFINGMVSNNKTIVDTMFEDAGLHDENGSWQSIFGLAVAPKYRNQGYAAKLVNHLIEMSKEQKRSGVTLTCKEHLINYYQSFGFTNLGLSESVHGGEIWYDLVLTFE